MSTRPIGTVLVALATLVVAGATLVLGLVRAEPAAAGATCVAVIVDFRQLGGTLQTGCAQGDPATGLQALRAAGFGYTPRPRDGLICQIDARPACATTTSSTYWSYWYRAASSSRWVYASEGASTHNPKPGSTEAWVWQAGGKTPPPAVRAAAICPQLAATTSPTPTPGTPKPKPSTKPSTKPTRSARPPTPSATPAHSQRSTAAAASTPTHSPTSSSTTTSPAASPAASDNGSAAGASGPPGNDAGGGGLGVAIGGVVIVGLGTATVIRARRARSS